MLTEQQKQQLGEETVDVYDDIELEMLEATGRQLAKLETEDGNILGEAIIAGAAALLVAHRGIVNSYSQSVSNAVQRDTYGALMLNAATELTGNEPNAASILNDARVTAASMAPTITQNLLRNNQTIINSANSAYYQAAFRAASEVAQGVNAKDAIARAVSDLSRQGVTYSTYTRVVNGIPQTVHVPVDVGIRREIFTDINDRLTQQVFDMAEQTGCNLVEVSYTTNPRESHAEWEGQVYQLNGAGEYQNFYIACRYGDPADGYGGYNCGHTMALYHGYRHFTDPLEGTGYTKEEAYALSQRQRYYENEIRKDKRERDVLRASGLPTDKVNARLANHQRQMNSLIQQHSAVLTNQTWRTRIYAAASEEQQRVILASVT